MPPVKTFSPEIKGQLLGLVPAPAPNNIQKKVQYAVDFLDLDQTSSGLIRLNRCKLKLPASIMADGFDSDGSSDGKKNRIESVFVEQ